MASTGRQVSLNTDTNFLKLIAMVTMTLDHVGKMFFPQYPLFRIIGRMAFPIYCYCLAAGCVYTKNPLRYALRVLALALVSQPIYCLALSHVNANMTGAISAGLTPLSASKWYLYSFARPNVLFSLLAGIVMIASIRERRYILTGLALLLVWRLSAYLDYGWRGVALMLIFYAFIDRPVVSFLWAAGFMTWWAMQSGGSYALFNLRFSMQIFALLALPLIYIPTKTGIRCGKALFYLYYPLHLLLIYLCLTFIH